MTVLGEPIPIAPDDPLANYHQDEYLRQLYLAATNLSLLQRSGAIQHGDKVGNLAAKYIVYTSNGVADTEDAVTHNLGHAPSGRIIVDQDKAATLYRSRTTLGDNTYIYLKSSAIAVAWKAIVF